MTKIDFRTKADRAKIDAQVKFKKDLNDWEVAYFKMVLVAASTQDMPGYINQWKLENPKPELND